MFEIVDNFLNKKSNLPKIIIIYWPTASGKTSMSIKIAKYLDSEIIGADSRQIYRLLNIWSGKITEQEKQWILHYMIDIIDVDKDYSVWEFKKEANKIIQDIISRWKIPIICWWTWLYLDAIAFNFNIPEIVPDWELRNKLEELRKEKWNEYIWDMLYKIDPEYANTIEKNNYRYVIRWIEVKEKTWKSKLELKQKLEPLYDILFLTPQIESREKLYEKINKRIEEMFNEWLIDEVKNILKIYPKNSFGLNTIWYKEIIEYLDWIIDLDKCKELVKQHNRNYAKRQFCWFKKYNSFKR